MDIQGRIVQSIRPRRDGVLLRGNLKAMGSASQVSAALLALCRSGQIQKIARGVYVTPQKLALLGERAVLESAHERQAKLRQERAGRRKRSARVLTPTARYVIALAKRLGISYTPTYSDQWASAITRLAGDEVSTDSTDDLLVALTRAGKLTPHEMTKLVIEHHRKTKAHV